MHTISRLRDRVHLGRKVSDEFTVPLCRKRHQELHRHGTTPRFAREMVDLRTPYIDAVDLDQPAIVRVQPLQRPRDSRLTRAALSHHPKLMALGDFERESFKAGDTGALVLEGDARKLNLSLQGQSARRVRTFLLLPAD